MGMSGNPDINQYGQQCPLSVTFEPGTLNLEPGTLNLEPGTLNPEP
jgi:hypothetical protein